jgi:hypothetical protein
VYTRVQTPRFCGQLFSAGLEVFQRGGLRPLRTSWLNVGTVFLFAIPKKRRAIQKSTIGSNSRLNNSED